MLAALLGEIKFKCLREECSESHDVYSYQEYRDHCDEHLEEDSALTYRSVDQPQNKHIYNGLRKISQCRSLQKHDDFDLKKPATNQEEEKVAAKEISQNLNKKGNELRKSHNLWSKEVSFLLFCF